MMKLVQQEMLIGGRQALSKKGEVSGMTGRFKKLTTKQPFPNKSEQKSAYLCV